MNNEHIAINIQASEVKPTSTIVFVPGNDKPWVMQISKDKGVEFNREAYPEWPPDEFAEAVIQILEHSFDVTFNRREPPYDHIGKVKHD